MSEKLVPNSQVEQVFAEIQAMLAKRFPCPYSDDPEHPDARVQLTLTNLSTHEPMSYMAARRHDDVCKMSDDKIAQIRDTLMFNLSIAYRDLEMFHRLEKLRLDNRP